MANERLRINGDVYRFKLSPTRIDSSFDYQLTLQKRFIPTMWKDKGYEFATSAADVHRELRSMIEETIEPDDTDRVLKEALEAIAPEYDKVEYES